MKLKSEVVNRLRLGHTQITHCYLMDVNSNCMFGTALLAVQHIIWRVPGITMLAWQDNSKNNAEKLEDLD